MTIESSAFWQTLITHTPLRLDDCYGWSGQGVYPGQSSRICIAECECCDAIQINELMFGSVFDIYLPLVNN